MRAGEEVLHAIFFAVAYSGIPVIGMGPQGPHWEITPKEAKDLDQAWVRMWRHYAPQVSEKTADIINFGTCAGRIVAPRVVQTMFDKRTHAHARAREGMGHNGGPPLNSPATNGTPNVAAPPAATSPPTTTTRPSAATSFVPHQPPGAQPLPGMQTPGEQDRLAMTLTHTTAGRA